MIGSRNNYFLWVFFALFLIKNVHAQSPIVSDEDYKSLKKWSIVIGPTRYSAGKVHRDYGNYNLISKPIFSMNVGVELSILASRNLSLNSGLFASYEPEYNIKLTAKQEDLPVDQIVNNEFSGISRVIVTFSIPLMLEYKKKLNDHLNVLFDVGYKAMYFSYGRSSSGWSYRGTNNIEYTILDIVNDSPKNVIQGSFVAGMGISLKIRSALVRVKLLQTLNFQNTLMGEYKIYNLLVSEPTGGRYTISGNYTGLMFYITLPK